MRVPPEPVPWPAARQNKRELQLAEIAIVRRTIKGESQASIAAALRMNPSSVSLALRRMRDVFGVASDSELVAHPDVVAQVEGSS